MKEEEAARNTEIDYLAGIHRLVDKIADRKLLITIYNFINRYYNTKLNGKK